MLQYVGWGTCGVCLLADTVCLARSHSSSTVYVRVRSSNVYLSTYLSIVIKQEAVSLEEEQKEGGHTSHAWGTTNGTFTSSCTSIINTRTRNNDITTENNTEQ